MAGTHILRNIIPVDVIDRLQVLFIRKQGRLDGGTITKNNPTAEKTTSERSIRAGSLMLTFGSLE
jgi:hypothetical protein